MASIINASTSGAGGVITTADASGVLQLQTAGTTAITVDASQNVTFAKPFAGNGPAFSVYQSSTQTVAPNTQTKVVLNVESFDTNNNFDSTTNYRFTPNVAGYYQINGLVKFSTSTSTFLASVANVSIFKNGSAYRGGTQNTIGGASYTAFSVSDVVFLNGSTDYVELYTAHNYSSNLQTLVSDGGAITVYFSGAMVRSA